MSLAQSPFLSSDDAAAITGVALPVDCGLIRQHCNGARTDTRGFLGGAMDRLRIAVIGLGWFGEFHCAQSWAFQTCARRAVHAHARATAMAAKFGVSKTTRDYRELLADPEIDAVSIVTMWDQHTEPAYAALEAGKHSPKSRLPPRSRIRKHLSLPPSGRKAFCRLAISADLIRATEWRSRRLQRARWQNCRHELASQHDRTWTP